MQPFLRLYRKIIIVFPNLLLLLFRIAVGQGNYKFSQYHLWRDYELLFILHTFLMLDKGIQMPLC